MPKSSNSSSTPALTPTKPVDPKPTMVPVFNHTNHMIDIGIALRTAGPGLEAKIVTFLPGNNSIDSRDLEKCQAHSLWHIHIDRHEHRGLTGKKYKGVQLQVGLHDEEFEVESKELGKRMHQLKQKKAS